MAGGQVQGFWSQERIVLALAVALFAVSAALLPGFRSISNLINIVHSVSVLGLLAVGMAIIIIGRGIDLSAVAIMAMSAAWYLQLLNNGWSEWQALGTAGAGVLAVGLINGFLVAYAEVPAIFATLATVCLPTCSYVSPSGDVTSTIWVIIFWRRATSAFRYGR